MDYTRKEIEKAYQASIKLKFLFFWGLKNIRVERLPAPVLVNGGQVNSR